MRAASPPDASAAQLRESRVALATVLALLACAKAPAAVEPAQAPPDPRPALAAQVQAVEAELLAVRRAQAQALWASWTTGAPLAPAAAWAGHEALLEPTTFALLARARRLQAVEVEATRRLDLALVGEFIARATEAAAAAVAAQELQATFTVNGKSQPLKDLPRALANEPSALKRKALWAAGLQALGALDAALAAQDAAVERALAERGFGPVASRSVGAAPSPALPGPGSTEGASNGGSAGVAAPKAAAEPAAGQALEGAGPDDDGRDATTQFAVALRTLAGASPESEALALLEQTDARWAALLDGLSSRELRLPRASATRADLPRLLKASSAVEAALPREKLGERLRSLLASLGLSALPLQLELDDAPRRNPLPLALALTPGDVRVSLRPAGGLRDASASLEALGRAVGQVQAGNAFAQAQLGATGRLDAVGALFARLLRAPAWLAQEGLSAAQAAAVAEAAEVAQLAAARRAAAGVLTALLPPAQRRAGFLAQQRRVLGLSLDEADAARARVEADPLLRGASVVHAFLAAQTLEAQLGEGWWREAKSAQALAEFVQAGAPRTSQPAIAADGGTPAPSLAPDGGAGR